LATSTGSTQASGDKREPNFLPGGPKPRRAPVIIDKCKLKNATHNQNPENVTSRITRWTEAYR